MARDDAELLAEAGRGSQSAFATLYKTYETDLYRFVFYLAGGPDEAEELFQETWFRAVRHLGKKQVDDFKKWLFTIAANLYKDELRKKKVRRLFLGREPTEENYGDSGAERGALAPSDIPPAAENFVIREALGKAMKNLSHKQRTIFVLTYVEGYKIREVSEILGKAEGTIKSTLHRAVLILREELKDFRG